MAELNFDPSSVADAGDYQPLPAGTYLAAIVAEEKKTSKAGNSHYLELMIEVLAGEHKGRRVIERLSFWNTNETAVAIAQRKLKKICEATGLAVVRDSAELLDLPMTIKTKIEIQKDGEYAGRASAIVVDYAKPTGPASHTPTSDLPW